jgi:hypothetical protein
MQIGRGPPCADGDGDELESGDGDFRAPAVRGGDVAAGVGGAVAGVFGAWRGGATTGGVAGGLTIGLAVALLGGSDGAAEGTGVCTPLTDPVALLAVIRESGSTTNTSSAQATAASPAVTA